MIRMSKRPSPSGTSRLRSCTRAKRPSRAAVVGGSNEMSFLKDSSSRLPDVGFGGVDFDFLALALPCLRCMPLRPGSERANTPSNLSNGG